MVTVQHSIMIGFQLIHHIMLNAVVAVNPGGAAHHALHHVLHHMHSHMIVVVIRILIVVRIKIMQGVETIHIIIICGIAIFIFIRRNRLYY